MTDRTEKAKKPTAAKAKTSAERLTRLEKAYAGLIEKRMSERGMVISPG